MKRDDSNMLTTETNSNGQARDDPSHPLATHSLTFICVGIGDLQIKVNLFGSILFDDELFQLRQREANTIECYLVVVFIIYKLKMNIRHLCVQISKQQQQQVVLRWSMSGRRPFNSPQVQTEIPTERLESVKLELIWSNKSI